MSRIIIFGAGNTGIRVYKEELSSNDELIAFLDNDSSKWGSGLMGYEVCQPCVDTINRLDYDEIIIASVQAKDEIRKQLISYGVNDDSIRIYKRDTDCFPFFLRNLRELFEGNGISGSVGEAGVFQGETAAKINEAFPDRKLYLFDTFCGFSRDDADVEKSRGYSNAVVGQFANTSEEIVMDKMKYPQLVHTVKGYFPDSASGIDDLFCFFRLDLDLYKPTALGLDYIHNKMVKGGVVVVHDYFGDSYKGIRESVNEYVLRHEGLNVSPLGDRFSIVITGY